MFRERSRTERPRRLVRKHFENEKAKEFKPGVHRCGAQGSQDAIQTAESNNALTVTDVTHSTDRDINNHFVAWQSSIVGALQYVRTVQLPLLYYVVCWLQLLWNLYCLYPPVVVALVMLYSAEVSYLIFVA